MPAGQAVHTGCLSAAPQRFVIGSNSFRSLTCFEVRSGHILTGWREELPTPRPRSIDASNKMAGRRLRAENPEQENTDAAHHNVACEPPFLAVLSGSADAQ